MSCCSVDSCSSLGDTNMSLDILVSRYKNQQRLSAPMVSIGIYIAGASLACTFLMAADVILGFRNRKLWFPCKYFTLNAFSLALLAVAMKLPVDLTSSGKMDELAKLSSTTFMCTVMSNFMPSIGPMGNKELLMNITALGILIITMFANVEIQTRTEAITTLIVEHNVVRYLMLVFLVIIIFSALIVPTFKKILKLKYDDKHQVPLEEEFEETEKFTVEKLRGNGKKYWIMAESGGPQFVMASSATCSASGAISFLASLALAIAEIKTYLSGGWKSFDPSDYKWTAIPIILIQSTGVVVGNIGAPAFRWFTASSFKFSKKGGNMVFKIEKYWIQRLVEWKERPIGLNIRSRKCRKFVEDTKNLILFMCIVVQKVIVVVSKIVLLIPNFFMSIVLSCSCCNPWMKRHWGLEPETEELDLSHYVLQLEGEEELPRRFLKNISNSVNQLIQKAKKQQPKNLMDLLEKSTSFKGVASSTATKFHVYILKNLLTAETCQW